VQLGQLHQIHPLPAGVGPAVEVWAVHQRGEQPVEHSGKNSIPMVWHPILKFPADSTVTRAS
jgi:hypothetical protein